jgi:hypothetical protein
MLHPNRGKGTQFRAAKGKDRRRKVSFGKKLAERAKIRGFSDFLRLLIETKRPGF